MQKVKRNYIKISVCVFYFFNFSIMDKVQAFHRPTKEYSLQFGILTGTCSVLWSGGLGVRRGEALSAANLV